jgi:hypothetical protein
MPPFKAGLNVQITWSSLKREPSQLPCSLADRGQLRGKGADATDLIAACKLLFQRGSDAQFGQYLTMLKESKVNDTEKYRQMWGVVQSQRSPRVLPILKLLLSDRRIASAVTNARYCDIAVSRLEDYSGEKFAFKVWDKATLPERNLAVGRARIWVDHAAHGAKSLRTSPFDRS